MIRRFFVLVGMVLFVADLVHPAEGRKEIFEPVVLDGSVSDISGQYFLSRNISASTDTPAITVIGGPAGAEQVEIDLNGFQVLGEVRGGAGTPVIDVSGVSSITVRNGTIGAVIDQKDGIVVTNVGDVVIEDVRLTSAHWAISIDSALLFAVRRCRIDDSQGIAIRVVDSSIGTLEGNRIANVTSFGAYVSQVDSVTIADNRVQNGSHGIHVIDSTGVVIRDNTVETTTVADAIGVNNTPGCRIVDNVVHDAADDGIAVLSDDCIVQGNASTANTKFGLRVEGNGNQILDNLFNSNLRGGIALTSATSDNTLVRNTARRNTGTPTCTTTPPGACATPDFCDSGTNNTSLGQNAMPGPC